MEGEPASYAVKRVDFFGRSVKICMQNNNGPCPLLAIANVLSLRNELKLPSGLRSITQSELITAITDLLLERSKHLEEASAADYQQTISDIFPVLQKLTTGIDVNVKFHNSHAFEATPEVAVFDLLGIPLVHGWLVDPQDTATTAVFGNKSYNELVELLLLGLGDAEKEQLATGPLRSLSFTPSRSFSRDHEQPQQQVTPQPFSQLQLHQSNVSPAAPSQSTLNPQTLADAAGSTPSLPRIATRSTSDAAAAATEAVAHSQPAAAAGTSSNNDAVAPQDTVQLSEADVVIEQLVDEMMQHLCCDTMPDKIELGDSPTLNTKINRKLAYEGAAPSRLSNSGSTTTIATAAAAQPLPSVSPPAAPSSSTSAALSPQAAATAVDQAVTPVQQRQLRLPSSTGGKPAAAAAAGAQVVRQFMELHCTQLTPYGLESLAENLKEHQLAVFFRNNHFNTLFKFEGGVFLLVTDQGYECEPDIVWERLDSVNGDTTFCTGNFIPFVPHRDPDGPPTYSQVAGGTVDPDLTNLDAAIAASLAVADGSDDMTHQNNMLHDSFSDPLPGHEDADFALALQLQLQEEEAAREATDRQQQRQQQQQQHPQQQQRGQQQHPQQQQQQQPGGSFTPESLAAGVRQMGRRIVSSAEKAASNLQQQRQQYVQQQQAMHAAQQQQHAAQQQRQYMLQQEQQRQQRRAQAAGGVRKQQQDEKCSIM